MLDELKALARRLGRPPRIRDVPVALGYDLQIHFKGLRDALRAAALRPTKRRSPPAKWTLARVLEEVGRLDARGVPITRRAITGDEYESPRGLGAAIAKHAGGYRRARALAGIDDPEREAPADLLSERALIREIRARHARKQPLAWSQLNYELRRSAEVAFGNWRNAVIAAGVDYDAVRLQHQPYTKDEILRRLRALARKEPRITAGQLGDRAIARAAVKRFGSLVEAVAAAGINDWPRRVRSRIYSREEILELLRVRRRARRPMARHLLQADDPRLARAIERRFGDWSEAMRAAGVPYERARRTWTRESVIDALRARHQAGQAVHAHALAKEEPGLLSAAIRHLGSARRILELLGLPPRQPRREGRRRRRRLR